MKLRPKDTETHANKPESIMAQMAVLLSEKDDIIEQKIDVIALSKQAQPLINLLRESQHSGPLVCADETRIQVLKEPGRSPTSDKWMWVTLGGWPQQQSVLFEYDPSLAREVTLRLLDGFTHGYLQTDGYAGYNEVCKQNNLIHYPYLT
jgi:hypothetical protein